MTLLSRFLHLLHATVKRIQRDMGGVRRPSLPAMSSRDLHSRRAECKIPPVRSTTRPSRRSRAVQLRRLLACSSVWTAAFVQGLGCLGVFRSQVLPETFAAPTVAVGCRACCCPFPAWCSFPGGDDGREMPACFLLVFVAVHFVPHFAFALSSLSRSSSATGPAAATFCPPPHLARDPMAMEVNDSVEPVQFRKVFFPFS